MGSILRGRRLLNYMIRMGFLLELVIGIAQEQGWEVDRKGFEQEMEKQRLQSGKKEVKKEELNIT